MNILENLLYSRDHEWVKIEGNNAYIGITDYAQNALGSIVFVELPEADTTFSSGDTFGTIESVKAASDLYIPIDGRIIEINETLVDDPALINENPYDNWIICVELLDISQLDGLMKVDDYTTHCSGEV